MRWFIAILLCATAHGETDWELKIRREMETIDQVQQGNYQGDDVPQKYRGLSQPQLAAEWDELRHWVNYLRGLDENQVQETLRQVSEGTVLAEQQLAALHIPLAEVPRRFGFTPLQYAALPPVRKNLETLLELHRRAKRFPLDGQLQQMLNELWKPALLLSAEFSDGVSSIEEEFRYRESNAGQMYVSGAFLAVGASVVGYYLARPIKQICQSAYAHLIIPMKPVPEINSDYDPFVDVDRILRGDFD